MLAIGHTAIGTIIGVAATQLAQPDQGLTPAIPLIIIATIIGLISHYLTDRIPHGHYQIDLTQPTTTELIKLLADTILPWATIGLFLLLKFGPTHPYTWIITATIFGAQLPDIIYGLRRNKLLPTWAWLEKEAHFHSNTHNWHNPHNHTLSTPNGGRKITSIDSWQAATVIAAALTLVALI